MCGLIGLFVFDEIHTRQEVKELGSWKLQLRGNKVGNSWRLWGRREGCEQSSAVASMETRPSSIRSSRGRGAPSAIWVIEELAAEDRKAGMLPGRQQTDCLFPQQRHKGMVIPMVLFEPHNDLGGEIHPVGSQCPAMLNYLECPEYHMHSCPGYTTLLPGSTLSSSFSPLGQRLHIF